jgi:hypothetical protein
MRAVLLDWLVEVHYQFGFTPETFYMAAKTMDRYLQVRISEFHQMGKN